MSIHYESSKLQIKFQVKELIILIPLVLISLLTIYVLLRAFGILTPTPAPTAFFDTRCLETAVYNQETANSPKSIWANERITIFKNAHQDKSQQSRNAFKKLLCDLQGEGFDIQDCADGMNLKNCP